MPTIRPILTRSWTLLAYSVPTSFLLLFGAAQLVHDPERGRRAEEAASSAVVLGNRELVVMMILVAVLVLLSMGSAIQHWLDARRTELFIAHLAGAAVSRTVADLLGVVALVHVAGFSVGAVGYAACRACVGSDALPPLRPEAISAAFSASTLLMLVAAGVAIGAERHHPPSLRSR